MSESKVNREEPEPIKHKTELPKPLTITGRPMPKSVSVTTTDSSSPTEILNTPKQQGSARGVTRSKSSYSFSGLETSPILSASSGGEQLSGLSRVPTRKRSPTADTFKDLDHVGLSGIWNHPMTRYDKF